MKKLLISSFATASLLISPALAATTTVAAASTSNKQQQVQTEFYGIRVVVAPHGRIRDSKKWKDLENLAQQLQNQTRQAKQRAARGEPGSALGNVTNAATTIGQMCSVIGEDTGIRINFEVIRDEKRMAQHPEGIVIDITCKVPRKTVEEESKFKQAFNKVSEEVTKFTNMFKTPTRRIDEAFQSATSKIMELLKDAAATDAAIAVYITEPTTK